ncbi:MAG: phenylalanine--tRNA ligase subunit alpha [Nitrososphaeraceae archaeon]
MVKGLKSLIHPVILQLMQDRESQLHPIEKSLLKTLASNRPMSVENLSELTGLNVDQVRRGIEWLKYKGLISVNAKSITKISIGKNGLYALENRFPERRLVELVKQGFNTMQKLSNVGVFHDNNESTAAFRHAVYLNKWLNQSPPSKPGDDATLVTLPGSDEASPEEALLMKIHMASAMSQDQVSSLSQEELRALNSLKNRHFIVEHTDKVSEIILSDKGRRLLTLLKLDNERLQDEAEQHLVNQLTPQLIASGRWKDVRFSPLDVEAPTTSLHAGKKHPLQNLIDEIKEVFIGMGFLEIDGPLIQSSFWNFDVLFTPQDHPAREMQDTFYIPQTYQTIPTKDRNIIDSVSRVHKKGWHYEWDPEESKRTVLRTHTTPVTLRYLSSNKTADAKLFTVGKVFRNEKASYKHLVEFNQIEGIVTGNSVTLRDLMGLQMEFYSKLGINKVKFWPTFFPYTEPSLQSMIFNESLGKWVELFGMGVFRPEVTEPLGIRNPVLAWGGGIERIAMLRFGLNDVRDLYSNNLGWLRSVPRYQS